MRKTLCGLLLLTSISTWAQGVHPISGRHYAGVMGVGGADWLVRPEREMEEEPDKALDAIGIAKGSSETGTAAGTALLIAVHENHWRVRSFWNRRPRGN